MLSLSVLFSYFSDCSDTRFSTSVCILTAPSSFSPRNLLEHADDFGMEADVVWRYASNLDEALRLSRAIDQHTQALGINRLLRRGRHSMTDLARVLGERSETLAAKLRGRAPAPERDLILWSWMTATPRTHRPISELVRLAPGADTASLLPVLGLSSRRVAASKRSAG